MILLLRKIVVYSFVIMVLDVEFSGGEDEFEIHEVQVDNSDISAKIVGGKVATQGQFPYSASLQVKVVMPSAWFWRHSCGATVLSPTTALTAAHCCSNAVLVNETLPSNVRRPEYRLVMGTNNLFNERNNANVQISNVAAAVSHPNYYPRQSGFANDLCVLYLETQLTTTNTVGEVSVRRENPTQGERCKIWGWGDVKENSHGSLEALRYAKVPILPDSACARVYRSSYDAQSMFCAGYIQGGIDSCQGDSGGGLVCDGNELVGVVSFGFGCARPGIPGVYARVSGDQYAWITSLVSSAKSAENAMALEGKAANTRCNKCSLIFVHIMVFDIAFIIHSDL